ncbi:MAG: hypothetical protein LBS68_03655, partial [Puniceicoccales bacterium]|nr:hypothetical protein [Puniceicoccales bacterium]
MLSDVAAQSSNVGILSDGDFRLQSEKVISKATDSKLLKGSLLSIGTSFSNSTLAYRKGKQFLEELRNNRVEDEDENREEIASYIRALGGTVGDDDSSEELERKLASLIEHAEVIAARSIQLLQYVHKLNNTFRCCISMWFFSFFMKSTYNALISSLSPFLNSKTSWAVAAGAGEIESRNLVLKNEDSSDHYKENTPESTAESLAYENALKDAFNKSVPSRSGFGELEKPILLIPNYEDAGSLRSFFADQAPEGGVALLPVTRKFVTSFCQFCRTKGIGDITSNTAANIRDGTNFQSVFLTMIGREDLMPSDGNSSIEQWPDDVVKSFLGFTSVLISCSINTRTENEKATCLSMITQAAIFTDPFGGTDGDWGKIYSFLRSDEGSNAISNVSVEHACGTQDLRKHGNKIGDLFNRKDTSSSAIVSYPKLQFMQHVHDPIAFMANIGSNLQKYSGDPDFADVVHCVISMHYDSEKGKKNAKYILGKIRECLESAVDDMNNDNASEVERIVAASKMRALSELLIANFDRLSGPDKEKIKGILNDKHPSSSLLRNFRQISDLSGRNQEIISLLQVAVLKEKLGVNFSDDEKKWIAIIGLDPRFGLSAIYNAEVVGGQRVNDRNSVDNYDLSKHFSECSLFGIEVIKNLKLIDDPVSAGISLEALEEFIGQFFGNGTRLDIRNGLMLKADGKPIISAKQRIPFLSNFPGIETTNRAKVEDGNIVIDGIVSVNLRSGETTHSEYGKFIQKKSIEDVCRKNIESAGERRGNLSDMLQLFSNAKLTIFCKEVDGGHEFYLFHPDNLRVPFAKYKDGRIVSNSTNRELVFSNTCGRFAPNKSEAKTSWPTFLVNKEAGFEKEEIIFFPPHGDDDRYLHFAYDCNKKGMMEYVSGQQTGRFLLSRDDVGAYLGCPCDGSNECKFQVFAVADESRSSIEIYDNAAAKNRRITLAYGKEGVSAEFHEKTINKYFEGMATIFEFSHEKLNEGTDGNLPVTENQLAAYSSIVDAAGKGINSGESLGRSECSSGLICSAFFYASTLLEKLERQENPNKNILKLASMLYAKASILTTEKDRIRYMTRKMLSPGNFNTIVAICSDHEKSPNPELKKLSEAAYCVMRSPNAIMRETKCEEVYSAIIALS